MSGHVVGDDYETEIAELTRVAKDGGYICLTCDFHRTFQIIFVSYVSLPSDVKHIL